MFYTYILRSVRTHRFYSGQCNNFENRLREHNTGESKATRSGIPWEIIFVKEFPKRAEAMQEEKKIKSRGTGRYLENKTQPGSSSSR